MKKMVVAALAAAIASASAAPALADTPPPLPTVPGVPVLGQAWVGNTVDARLAVLTIHGVRRTEGATILYYSLGLRPQDRTGNSAFFDTYGNGNFYALNQNSASGLACTAAAIDVTGGTAYSALRTDKVGRCLSTRNLDLVAPANDLGRTPVGWVALAPVPATVTTVDVLVGSQIVQDVAVQDGLLEPVVAEPAPTVGMGWPRIDTGRLSEAIEPDRAVFALRTQVQDVASSITQASSQGAAQLDLDAAVLFATDQATLTPRANDIIAEAARQITAAGTSGTVTVTGHTDSTASDAYNLDLSNRRAAAVVSALAPRIPPGITITAVGKGESEPIADNGTPEGRALNRRVTITLPQ